MLERAQRAWTTSKLYWAALMALQLAAVGFAAWVAWARPERGRIAVLVSVLGLLVPVVTLFLRGRAGDAYARGEVWRRAFLLSDSLGHEPSRAEFVSLTIDAEDGGVNWQRKPTGKYYASDLAPGPARLLENLAESAFYTTRLSRAMSGVCSAVVVIALVALGAVIVGVLSSPMAATDGDTWLELAGPRLGGVFSVVLSFVAAGQVYELATSYAKLSAAARAVLNRAIEPREEAFSLPAVLSLVGSYEAALAAAAVPIPDMLARAMGAKLNAEWTQARAVRTGTPAPT